MSIKYDATGFYNLREAGGMLANGGRVKTLRFLRSGFPDSLDAENVAFFQEMPLVSVLDLRTSEEVAMFPHLFADAGFDVVSLPLLSGSVRSMLQDVPSVGQMYLDMLAASPKELTAAVIAVANATAKGTVLVHCTAGKDRTGVVCALVQAVLGVSDQDIVANYVLSHDNLEGAWMDDKEKEFRELLEGKTGGGLEKLVPHEGDQPASEFREVLGALFSAPKLLKLMTGSPAEAIEGVLAKIREEHGSARGFLLANGATQADLDTLRANLINEASGDNQAS